LAGRICNEFGISPIIGEIAAGVALGPEALNLVPYVPDSSDGGHHDESVWKLLGQFGVTLMIAESGTHIHFKKLREVGANALVIAILGTFIPLLLGMGFFLIMGEDFLVSFAAGAALAPTSVGIALKLLGEANQLNSIPGQTIVTAAFLDDIFSLILLVIVLNLKDEVTAMTIIGPFVQCFLFLGWGLFSASRIVPKVVPWILSQLHEVSKSSFQPRDEIHLGLMVLLLICYSWIASFIGSHLLGAFVAGMSFCEVPRSMYIWRSQLKRISAWLVRLFFCATVAFSIPVSSMFTLESFWKGLILAIIPTVAGKIVAGVFAGKWKWVIGVAMVGRGEFAYLVAENCLSEGLITVDTYAICVWALLLAVVVGPLLFKYVLERAFRDKQRSGIKYFEINASGQHHNNIHFEIVDTLHHLQLDVLEAEVETDGQVDTCKFIVSCGENEDLDEDMIAEIRHDIVEALNDPEAQVNLAPHDQDLANDQKEIVEIRIMSQHHPSVLPEILNLFVQLHLDVIKIHTEDHLDIDTDVFFCEQNHDKGETESVDLAVIRYGLRDIFHQHNEKCEVMVKRVSRDRVNGSNTSSRKRMLEDRHRSKSAAAQLLNAHGDGFEISFTLDKKPPTKFLVEISYKLCDLDLDVIAIDFTLDERGLGMGSCYCFIHTRDIKHMQAKECHASFDTKRRRQEVEFQLSQMIKEEHTDASLTVVDKKESDDETDDEGHQKKNKALENRPKLTRRLTKIHTDGKASLLGVEDTYSDRTDQSMV